MNKHFDHEDIQMANKHMEGCSLSVIREMHMKTTVIYQYWNSFKYFFNDSTKCWLECGANGTLIHCWRKCKVVQPLWKPVCQCLTTLNRYLPYDQQFRSQVINPREMKAYNHTKTSMETFTEALFVIANTGNPNAHQQVNE